MCVCVLIELNTNLKFLFSELLAVTFWLHWFLQ